MITLILPYPPSVNHYKNVGQPKKTKSGKFYQPRFNSKETIAFYYQVWMLSRSQSSKFFTDATIPLEVAIDLHPPDKRRSDIDNRIKVILDSLQRANVIANDFQIARLKIERCSIVEGGQVIVRIESLEGAK